MIREVYAVIFFILILALLVCVTLAQRSQKETSRQVALLVGSLVPPVSGNLVILLSRSAALSALGCYVYFLGMNLVMFALLHYTMVYCAIPDKQRKWRWIAYAFLILDSVSLLLNNLFHHAFGLEVINVAGQDYYRFVPFLGQAVHRVIDYGIFLTVLIIFLVKMIRSPRVLLEKYMVIFATMVVVGIWQSYYILSRTPVDRSMIGFGVFGLLVFYFSIYYRPMRLLDRMLITMASELQEALLFFDLNLQCIWANEKGLSMFGMEEQDLKAIPEMLIGLFGPPPTQEEDWSEQQKVEINGETREFFIQKKTVYDTKGRLAGSFLNIRDNSAERAELHRQRHFASHDSTTGLYNREYLFYRIRKKLMEEPGDDYYICLASVDSFELIIDVYGTAFGEQALKQIVDWIGTDIPEGSLCGRIGESEFGALVKKNPLDFRHLEQDLSHTIVRTEKVEQHVFIHFGIHHVTDPSLETSIMFDRARLALSKVRDSLTEYVGIYEDELRDSILWNHKIAAELQDALKENQIVPYLQPIMDADGQLKGAEVLARWNHPTEGFLQPGSFIPLFEKNGLISEVDRHMWRWAAKLIAEYEKENRDLFLSVNISPKDFEVMDIVKEVKDLVEEFGIRPEHLRLEITETAIGIQQKSRINTLKRLREEGFLVEMDDFGSGYSSMNLLKDMPLDLMKLDMVFLEKSEDTERAKMIVRMIISMAHQLGIDTLMEGVETEIQYQVLSKMGCEYFQGYYFSRPIPVEEFSRLLK